MKGIQYLILRFGLFAFFALVTSPFVIVLVLLIRYLDDHDQFRLLKWILMPFVLVWIFGLPWLTSQTAKRIAFEDQNFSAAVKLTYYDVRLRLSFLPLIGHWFVPHSDKRDTGDDDV
jgi:hypothetical protein